MASICVLMTSYNHAKFLRQAIESVLSQTYTDLELVIMDDASVDGSVDIAEEYAKYDNRVRVLIGRQNIGKAKLINSQLPLCNSDYLALLDSDDYWISEKLQMQLLRMNMSDEIGVVYSDGFLVDERPRPLAKHTKTAWPTSIEGKLFSDIHSQPKFRSGDLFMELLAGNFIFYSSALLRHRYIKTIRFQEHIRRSIDWFYFIDVAKECNFAYLDMPMAYYRIHGNNLQDLVTNSLEALQPRQYVLSKYGKLMPRAIRARHLRQIGNSYRRMTQYKLSTKFLQESLTNNPLDLRAWGYLFDSIIKMSIGQK